MENVCSKRETGHFTKKPQTTVTAPPGHGALSNKKKKIFINCQGAGCASALASVLSSELLQNVPLKKSFKPPSFFLGVGKDQ